MGRASRRGQCNWQVWIHKRVLHLLDHIQSCIGDKSSRIICLGTPIVRPLPQDVRNATPADQSRKIGTVHNHERTDRTQSVGTHLHPSKVYNNASKTQPIPNPNYNGSDSSESSSSSGYLSHHTNNEDESNPKTPNQPTREDSMKAFLKRRFHKQKVKTRTKKCWALGSITLFPP